MYLFVEISPRTFGFYRPFSDIEVTAPAFQQAVPGQARQSTAHRSVQSSIKPVQCLISDRVTAWKLFRGGHLVILDKL